MKLMLIKTEKGLRGATDRDHAEYQKCRRRLKTMKPGKWVRMEFSTPRHGPHHRKMMALFQLVTENSEVYTTVERLLPAIKLCVGHFDAILDPRTGEVVNVPRSICFESMPQEEFDVFYNAAVDAVLQHILPTMDRETADGLMDMIAEGWA